MFILLFIIKYRPRPRPRPRPSTRNLVLLALSINQSIMVVKTRSSNKKTLNNVVATGPRDDRPHHLSTPSFREASIWNYKIHTGRRRTNRNGGGCVHYQEQEQEQDQEQEHDMEALEASATEALVDIYDSPSPSPPNLEDDVVSAHACINPMQPITRYMYRISVYNSARTLHYKTAFILYNHKNRLYYVYTIVSNSYPIDDDDASSASDSSSSSASASDSSSGFPQPVNTIHMKYLSYICDTIMNYVTTLIVPHNDYDYFIQDDILGIVQSNDGAFTASVFGDESSYYDIDRLLHDKTSTETTNGFRVFQLIGSRNYWYDPAVLPSASDSSVPYTPETLQSVLQILGQSS